MSSATISLDEMSKRLDLISAQLSVIQARLEIKSAPKKSPWVPLAEAAEALHFSSAKSLRTAIARGRVPAQLVSATTGETGRRRTLYVDVEGFANYLRNKR